VRASLNYWTDEKCAKAFWGQHDLPPYRQLLADTVAWADPKPGEHWLDLGCGGGAISRRLWEQTQGRVAAVTAVDCAAANAEVYRRLRETLAPAPGDRLRFICHDFSRGLALFEDNRFDHVVSGLSISYAESCDPTTQAWDTAAYDRLLAETCRILRPRGRFVFSVNVPEPSWLAVGLRSLTSAFHAARPLHFLKNAWRMTRYGAWLKREARRGRFHYLPHQQVTAKLRAAGYHKVEHALSYAGQAYVFCAVKPLTQGHP
jgi:ubiquinone/menaquinone biosynthesis C-methylase UbiE